jgi:hypothetical protein
LRFGGGAYCPLRFRVSSVLCRPSGQLTLTGELWEGSGQASVPTLENRRPARRRCAARPDLARRSGLLVIDPGVLPHGVGLARSRCRLVELDRRGRVVPGNTHQARPPAPPASSRNRPPPRALADSARSLLALLVRILYVPRAVG